MGRRPRIEIHRECMGATGLTFSHGADGCGFSVVRPQCNSAVVSLSLDPPLVSFAVSTAWASWPAVRIAESCVINLLAADQHETARRFSRGGVDRFAPPVRWHRLESGEPVLDGQVAWIRGVIEQRIAAGGHQLVIASVENGEVSESGESLVYHEGRYRAVGDELVPLPPAQPPTGGDREFGGWRRSTTEEAWT